MFLEMIKLMVGVVGNIFATENRIYALMMMMIGQHRKVFPNPGMSSPLPLTDEIFGAF
jgi:hypothetical protein